MFLRDPYLQIDMSYKKLFTPIVCFFGVIFQYTHDWFQKYLENCFKCGKVIEEETIRPTDTGKPYHAECYVGTVLDSETGKKRKLVRLDKCSKSFNPWFLMYFLSNVWFRELATLLTSYKVEFT